MFSDTCKGQVLTRSSSSSASALNLLTKPDRPIDPFRPSATKGLSFESKALSRKTMRGYAMGMPAVLTVSIQRW